MPTLHKPAGMAGRGLTAVSVAAAIASPSIYARAANPCDPQVAVACDVTAPDGVTLPTRDVVRRRLERLIAEQPDRASLHRKTPGLLTPGKGVPADIKAGDRAPPEHVGVSVSLSEIAALAGARTPGSKPAFDVWIEGRHSNFDLSATTLDPSGRLSTLYVGTELKMRPGLMVGALAQFDHSVETQAGVPVSAEGAGFMGGPYASLELAPGLFLDGRAAWGVAETSVATDEHSGTIQANRSLLRAALSGKREYGPWRLEPVLGMTYLAETGAADSPFLAASGGGGDGIAVGRLEFLPSIAYRTHATTGAVIEPRATIGAIGTFQDLDRLGQAFVAGTPESLRLKAEAGIGIGLTSGARIDAAGVVEQGSDTTPENWTGKLRLSVPLR